MSGWHRIVCAARKLCLYLVISIYTSNRGGGLDLVFQHELALPDGLSEVHLGSLKV
jgi:hypothetical protein